MVRIRMQRLGRHKRPFYRINAVDARNPRDGTCLEQLGWYDPMATDEDKKMKLEEERIKHWLSKGAQPSDTVRDILGHRDLLSPKQKEEWEAQRKAARARVDAKLEAKRKAEEEAAAAAAAEAAAKAQAEAAKAAAKAEEEAAKAAETPAAE